MNIVGSSQLYQPTEHMFAIAERNLHQRPAPAAARTEMKFINIDKPAMGALEVYFMGVRLFSKIQSGMWPHIDLLA